jgi:hypothetical protein
MIWGITGIENLNKIAPVDPNTGNIIQYKSTIKLALGVEHQESEPIFL